MGPRTQLSVSEYLASSYEPEVDYVDGEIEERNMGEPDHAWLQAEIAMLLKGMGWRWTYTELRLQVAETRYRTPDVCVYPVQQERRTVPSTPPLLAVEILSPDDQRGRLLRKLGDYLAWGCPCVWIIDPEKHQGSVLTAADEFPRLVDTLSHPTEPALRVAVAQLFAE